MGVEYRLILMDEFDWNYAFDSRKETIAFILRDFPYFQLEASIPYMIVLDIGRKWPSDAVKAIKEKGCITFDKAYYQKDNDMELLPVEE